MKCGRGKVEVKKLTHYLMECGSRRTIEGGIASCVIYLSLDKHYREPLISRAEHLQRYFFYPKLNNVFEEQALN